MASKNSWDRLPPADMGNADANEIYLSVGIALSWFEILQVRVSWLFQLLVENDSLAMARAFGTLESVPPKVAMIRAAAAIRFMNNPESLKMVIQFMTQFGELSHRRNEIAHAHVTALTENGRQKGCFLHPGSHMTNRNTKFLQPNRDPLGDYRYTAEQVNYYTKEFRRLGGEIQDFLNAARTRDAPAAPASPSQ